MLALMVVSPVWAGSGDAPDDPLFFPQREIWFEFDEFTSTEPNDITYYVWQDVAGDSTLVATLTHIGGSTHSVAVDIAGDPGTVNRIVVWGLDASSGLTDHCEKFVAREEHACGRCWARLREIVD